MNRIARPLSQLIIVATLILSISTSSHCQEHIRKLDAVRTSMARLGSMLPDLTRKAETINIRTMERVFEINNYSLVTIESYFKMIKIALSSGTGINKEVLGILNGWLKFISSYSEYDIKYLDEALSQVKDPKIIDILKSEKENITSLRDASKSGIEENAASSSKQ